MDRRSEIKHNYKQTPRPIGVYQIKNLVNGKIFVGSNNNLHGAFNRHKFELSLGVHPIKALQEDWNQYGEGNFAFEILELLEPIEGTRADILKVLAKVEAKWLEKLMPYEDKGYNER